MLLQPHFKRQEDGIQYVLPVLLSEQVKAECVHSQEIAQAQPQLAQWLPNDLPYDLVNRFLQIGRLEVLEEGITLIRERLKLWLAPHLERSIDLNNLGWAVSIRFEQLGEYEDLDEAI